MSNTDWDGIVFMIIVFVTLVITAGDPDILDGLIKMANG